MDCNKYRTHLFERSFAVVVEMKVIASRRRGSEEGLGFRVQGDGTVAKIDAHAEYCF